MIVLIGTPNTLQRPVVNRFCAQYINIPEHISSKRSAALKHKMKQIWWGVELVDTTRDERNPTDELGQLQEEGSDISDATASLLQERAVT